MRKILNITLLFAMLFVLKSYAFPRAEYGVSFSVANTQHDKELSGWEADYSYLASIDIKTEKNWLVSLNASYWKYSADVFEDAISKEITGKAYQDYALLFGKSFGFLGANEISLQSGVSLLYNVNIHDAYYPKYNTYRFYGGLPIKVVYKYHLSKYISFVSNFYGNINKADSFCQISAGMGINF